MKICFDTPALLAALAAPKGASRQLLEKVIQGQIDLVSSDSLFEDWQYHAVGANSLTLLSSTEDAILGFFNHLRRYTRFPPPSFTWSPAAKDPADDLVLAAAVQGQADILVALRQHALSPGAKKHHLMLFSSVGALAYLETIDA